MADGQDIARNVPYLRRFARALAGSQAVGDACVMSALGHLTRNPDVLRAGPNLRAALYRAVVDTWQSDVDTATDDGARVSPDERGARQRLRGIGLRPRIAFLLSALEGFQIADIAAIMGVPRVEAAQLLDTAAHEISEQLQTEVLIIEDEPFIALDLKSLIEELGHRVTSIARTQREAVAAAKSREPGLILADIQLADGSSGLEAVNEILLQFEAPVIFVTAYPERFLTGKAPEPAFLITKPFGVESLKAVVSQALFFDRRSRRVEEPAVAKP